MTHIDKPDWSDAPHWANWLAMDGNGYWYFYEDEPEWDEEDEQWSSWDTPGLTEEWHGPDYSGIDWDQAWETLEARPE